MSNTLIKDLNNSEKPREKLISLGASNLTDEELIALIIRSGGKDVSAINLAREIIKQTGSLENILSTDLQQLKNIKHINIAKAAGIIAAIELGIRVSKPNKIPTKTVKKPEDVYKLLQKRIFKTKKEALYLISLDARNKIISVDLISIGSINETIVSPREIFLVALRKNAVGIIMTHNHPSNDPNPSIEDIKITENIAGLGKTMNIPLIDHVILTDRSFVSLKQLGVFTTWLKGGDQHE